MENLYSKYEMKKHANYFVLPSYTFKKACDNAYADMARHVLHIRDKTDEEKENLRNAARDLLKNRFINLRLCHNKWLIFDEK